MSTPKNDGGPAFPAIKHGPAGTVVVMSEGMTLRDWLAGQALVGMLAHPDTRLAGLDLTESMRDGPWAVADAMLAAREDRQ